MKLRVPKYWLETVTLEGREDPVTVTEYSREGSRVFVRQVDPHETDVGRVPIYEGDTIEVLKAISHISINLNDVVGDKKGFLLGLRVIPIRRESGKIIVRTLRYDEVDNGERVHLKPGESMNFEVGSILLDLEHVDRLETATSSGHVPLTPVLSNWFLTMREQPEPGWFRYLFSAARRMDAANLLFIEVQRRREELANPDIAGPMIRRSSYELIGAVEMAIIALARSVDMVVNANTLIGCQIPVPTIIEDSREALRQIRNAYEHIEDRALGNNNGRADSNALTIFDHMTLLTESRISYGEFELDLNVQLSSIFREVRDFLKAAAKEVKYAPADA